MERIKKNSAKCLLCGDVLVSEHKEDAKWCSCGNLLVEGGNDFIRRGVMQGRHTKKELSEFEEEYQIPEEDIKQFQEKVRKDWLNEVKKVGGLDAFFKAQSMTLPELQHFKNELQKDR